MIDAAGAIYVIGGTGYNDHGDGSGNVIYFQDVWASTDGGALPDAVKGREGRWVTG